MADIVTADPSILLQGQTPNFLGNFEQGMKMSALATQNKQAKQDFADDQATRAAFKNNMTVGPDGSPTIDTQGAMSDLANANSLNPKTVQTVNQVGLQQMQKKQAIIQNKLKGLEALTQMSGSVHDQQSYKDFISSGSNLGLIKDGDLPPVYDPEFFKSFVAQGMPLKEQLEKAHNTVMESIAQQNANSKSISSQTAAANSGIRADQRNESLHNDNVKQINDNPQFNALVTSANNISNAGAAFAASGAMPQDFSEYQQALRSNMGIKIGGGVSERGETYLNSMGISKDKAMQFITGDPQSVMKSDPVFAQKIFDIAKVETQNKLKQASDQIDQLASSHQSFYSKPQNFDRANDYKATVQAAKSRIMAPMNGPVQMRDPKGNIRMIPADKVNDALANGGVKL